MSKAKLAHKAGYLSRDIFTGRHEWSCRARILCSYDAGIDRCTTLALVRVYNNDRLKDLCLSNKRSLDRAGVIHSLVQPFFCTAVYNENVLPASRKSKCYHTNL